jgi:hypothetical protein
LIDESKPEEVKLVVRTINSSAFSDNDWKDLVVEVSDAATGLSGIWSSTVLLPTGSL